MKELEYIQTQINKLNAWIKEELYKKNILVTESGTYQTLLSGPFDASRIPADQVLGYMIWVEVDESQKEDGLSTPVPGWNEITRFRPDGGIICDGVYYDLEGLYDNKAAYAQLHFRPPTPKPLKERFEAVTGEHRDFASVEPKRSQWPDLHAFLLLDELFPNPGYDIIMCADEGGIWLDIDNKDLETLTDAHILELVRCGVQYSPDLACLFMP